MPFLGAFFLLMRTIMYGVLLWRYVDDKNSFGSTFQYESLFNSQLTNNEERRGELNMGVYFYRITGIEIFLQGNTWHLIRRSMFDLFDDWILVTQLVVCRQSKYILYSEIWKCMDCWILVGKLRWPIRSNVSAVLALSADFLMVIAITSFI